MTLLGYDGFEGIETADSTLRGWTFTATGTGWTDPSLLFTTGGIDGRRLYLRSPLANSYARSVCGKTITASTDLVVGFALLVDAANGAGTCGIIELTESGVATHLSVGVLDTGQIRVYRDDLNGTLLGSSVTGLITEGAWSFFEIRVKISDTVGEIEVFVEGNSVISLTGIDTRNGGTGVIDLLNLTAATTVALGPRAIASFDNLYWLDTAGAAPYNAPLGPVRIDQQVVTSDGATTDFTPSSGAVNHHMVDEALPNNDTDYNESGTATHKDIFGLADLATPSGTIFAVQTRVRARRTDADSISLIPSIISDGTEDDGASRSLGSTYAEYSDIFINDPDGDVAWSDAAVNALQIAYRTP